MGAAPIMAERGSRFGCLLLRMRTRGSVDAPTADELDTAPALASRGTLFLLAPLLPGTVSSTAVMSRLTSYYFSPAFCAPTIVAVAAAGDEALFSSAPWLS